MTVVNIHEAKTHFSRLIQDALQGKKIIIAKGGKPLVTLTPLESAMPPRRGGQLKGLIKISDDFDAPLPDEVLKQFYGEDE